MSVKLVDRGVPRSCFKVYSGDKHIGFVTSGTMVPYWKWVADGNSYQMTDEKGMRALALVHLDSKFHEGDKVEIEIKNRKANAKVVNRHIHRYMSKYILPLI